MTEAEEKLSLRLKNMLRLFLNSIRDYENQTSEAVEHDERESSEFVEIFIDSEDGFDYVDILKASTPTNEEVKDSGNLYDEADLEHVFSNFHHDEDFESQLKEYKSFRGIKETGNEAFIMCKDCNTVHTCINADKCSFEAKQKTTK